MDAKNWIAVGAAGALSLGVVAAGAVSTANAIPLIAGSTNIGVPAIAVPGDDLKGTVPLDFSVSSDSIVSPEPSSTPSPTTTVSPASAASPVTPPSAPSPVTPPSPASPASIPSPASPASND